MLIILKKIKGNITREYASRLRKPPNHQWAMNWKSEKKKQKQKNTKLQNLNMMSHQHSFLWQHWQKYQLSEVLRAQMVFGSPSVQLHWQLDTLDSWMGFGCNKTARFFRVGWRNTYQLTPLKTNMEPKNWSFLRCFSFSTGYFQVPAVSCLQEQKLGIASACPVQAFASTA